MGGQFTAWLLLLIIPRHCAFRPTMVPVRRASTPVSAHPRGAKLAGRLEFAKRHTAMVRVRELVTANDKDEADLRAAIDEAVALRGERENELIASARAMLAELVSAREAAEAEAEEQARKEAEEAAAAAEAAEAAETDPEPAEGEAEGEPEAVAETAADETPAAEDEASAAAEEAAPEAAPAEAVAA